MLSYRIGLPAWAFAGWQDRYFDSRDRLRQYASVFSTVEGNTTFYAIPAPATVQATEPEEHHVITHFHAPANHSCSKPSRQHTG